MSALFSDLKDTQCACSLR